MNDITHPEMVKVLAKSGEDVLNDLTPESAHNVHMALGIAGEAGELVDAVKKYAIYKKPVDIAHAIEEMGDLEFYLEGLRQGLDITREEVLKANIKKLGKRYEDFQYSNERANNRADKN